MPAFSAISHLGVESISFALSLRDEDDPNKALFDKMTDEERELLADNAKKRGARGPCKNKTCVKEETQHKLMIIDKARLNKELEEAISENELLAEEIEDVNKRNAIVVQENSDLKLTFDTLLPEKVRLSKELKDMASDRRQLTSSLTKLQKQYDKLKKQVDAKEASKSGSQLNSSSVASSRSLNHSDLNILPRDKLKGIKKHSGTLQFLPQRGRVVWSCCMMLDDEADGCLDDQSIGVKSTLIVKPSKVYKPFSTLPNLSNADLIPWRRTQRPAPPPQWPPLHAADRPRTATERIPPRLTLSQSMKLASNCKSPLKVALEKKRQSFKRQSSHYCAHDANCGCGVSYLKEGKKIDKTIPLDGGILLGHIHHDFRSTRPKTTEKTVRPRSLGYNNYGADTMGKTYNNDNGNGNLKKNNKNNQKDDIDDTVTATASFGSSRSGGDFGMIKVSLEQDGKLKNVNKKLTMFSGVHLRPSSTSNLCNIIP